MKWLSSKVYDMDRMLKVIVARNVICISELSQAESWFHMYHNVPIKLRIAVVTLSDF